MAPVTGDLSSDAAEQLTETGSWQWDPARDRMTWSANVYRILGLEPGDVRPSLEALLDPVHPDDRRRMGEVVGVAGDAWTGRTGIASHYRIVLDGGVRHLRLVVISTETSPARGGQIVGVIQDVTNQRWADRELAAYAASAEALAAWDSLQSGGRRLLGALGTAMEFASGILWVPRDDRLQACVDWGDRSVAAAARATALPRGVGLAGRAWESGRPVNTTDIKKKTAESLRVALDRAGMRGGMSIPACHEDEILAVLGFHSREETEMTQRLIGVLVGIGELVGSFLALHRGQLAPSVITERELEVLRLCADGMSVGEMGTELGISGATTKTHLEHIHRKLGVKSRAAAVAVAIRAGLID